MVNNQESEDQTSKSIETFPKKISDTLNHRHFLLRLLYQNQFSRKKAKIKCNKCVDDDEIFSRGQQQLLMIGRTTTSRERNICVSFILFQASFVPQKNFFSAAHNTLDLNTFYAIFKCFFCFVVFHSVIMLKCRLYRFLFKVVRTGQWWEGGDGFHGWQSWIFVKVFFINVRYEALQDKNSFLKPF